MTQFLTQIWDFTSTTLSDVAIIAAILNMFNTAGNIYWGWKLKEIQTTGATISYWKGKCEEQESKINEWERQYTNLLARHKVSEGKVATYEKFHKHPSKP